MTTEQKISFVKFSELKNWDVKKFIDSAELFNDSFKIAFFEDFSKPPKIEKIHIKDDKEYKVLGVRSYGYGTFVNRIVKGKSLKMKVYQQAKPNHLYWCKVDTKNGAFGIITEDLADGIASSNMTFADLDISKINPDYVQILFRSKKFNAYMDSFVTGTTNRKYIRPSQLYDEIQISLPPLNDAEAIKQGLTTEITQEKLVASYNKKIKEAEQAKQSAIDKGDEIEIYLYNQLGLSKIEKKDTEKGLHFVSFKDIDRWDTLFLQGQTSMLNSIHPLVKFSNIINAFNTDHKNISLRFETYKNPNNDFHYLGMENVNRNSGTLVDLPVVQGSQVKSQTIKVPNDYLIYGKLRPYLNKYWHNNTNFQNIVCSSEFFVFDIETAKIDKAFFIEILASSIIQNQIKDKFSGVRMPRISSYDFNNLFFPLPKSIKLQRKISEEIFTIREKIKSQKLLSESLKKQAIIDFEKIIFNTEAE